VGFVPVFWGFDFFFFLLFFSLFLLYHHPTLSDPPYDSSIPIEKALHEYGDVLLAYEMNGETLPREHGYPIRIVTPGKGGDIVVLGSLYLYFFVLFFCLGL
jgi:hypothetical protein